MNYRNIFLVMACATVLMACSNDSSEQSAPAPATTASKQAAESAPVQPSVTPRVYIVSPENGATISGPVTVVFGIEGYSVAPAGTYEDSTGHHHLLIDTDLPDLGQPIPADDNHIHFGKGQTETTLDLEPGEHRLQMLLGDGNHVPHSDPLVSEPIVITVAVE